MLRAPMITKNSPFTILLAAGLSLSGSACVRAPTFVMANPFGGTLGENSIQFRDRANEGQFGLPTGTLVDEASMATASDKEVCFNLKIRTPRRDLASLKGWRIFLRGKPTFEDMSSLVKAQGRVDEEIVGGSVLVQSQQNQQVCDNTGYCYTKTITISSRVPQDVKVYSTGGMVCFGNAGHMSTASQELTLHLDDPSPPAGGMFGALIGRVAFRWQFN